MTKEEIVSAFKFIVNQCDKIINNKDYVADDFVQNIVEDISEMCNRILDGQFGDIWRPSDEQLRPLEYAIDYFKKKRNDITYLESLYNDLKKL